jgi:sodium-independent sulfate anion transporter 11
MPAFYYLPKAVLAAVVISSVMFLVEYEEIKPMWKSRSGLNQMFGKAFSVLLWNNNANGDFLFT